MRYIKWPPPPPSPSPPQVVNKILEYVLQDDVLLSGPVLGIGEIGKCWGRRRSLGTKMALFIYFPFFFSILLQYYKFKMLHKRRSSHKNNDFIALLSSTHDLPPHSRTSTYISYLIVKDVHLYIITVSKRPKPSGARGGGGGFTRGVIIKQTSL